ncbi:MAG: hypothetical protein IPK97_12030 [Ahniella sp.]|nr:hypothetical protein [Ahniella sp.]
MSVRLCFLMCLLLGLSLSVTAAEETPAVAVPAHDAELAQRTGADEMGMRKFVLVILKSSETPVPKGPERDEMFKGHFANMGRLSKEGVLALAGPLDGVDGWRGLFVLAVEDIETAKRHVETDPVIVKGEMVAEYHRYYGSAALMLIPEWHERLQKPKASP